MTTVSYTLGPKRPRKPNQEIVNRIAAAVADVDRSLNVRVYSGAQSKAKQYGSARHNSGNTVDFYITRNGQPLATNDPVHVSIVGRLPSMGINEIGVGMSGGGIHAGIGSGPPAMWGYAPGKDASKANLPLYPAHVKAVQQALGVPIDGIYGEVTRQALAAINHADPQFTAAAASVVDAQREPGFLPSLFGRPDLAIKSAAETVGDMLGFDGKFGIAAKPGDIPSFSQAQAARGPTFDVPTRSLTAPTVHSAPKRTLTAPASVRTDVAPVTAANPGRLLDYAAGPIDAVSGANVAARMAAENIGEYRAPAMAERQAHREALAAAPRIQTGPTTANSPFAEPSFSNRGLPPGAQATPEQVADATRRLGAELQPGTPQRTVVGNPAGIDMAARRRMDPGVLQDAMETTAARQALATRADNNAPYGIGPGPAAPRTAAPIPRANPQREILNERASLAAMDARLAGDGLTPSAMATAFQRAQPRASAADNNAPYGIGKAPAMAASAAPVPRPSPRLPALPSRTVSAPRVSDLFGGPGTAPQRSTDIPASQSPGYPAQPPTPRMSPVPPAARPPISVMSYAPQSAPPSTAPTLRPSQWGTATPTPGTLAGFRSALASPPPAAPAPTYKPTPIASAPTLDELAYNGGVPVAPGAMAASAMPAAQPPSPFRKLAPGLISLAMASSPMGVFGAFGRLAAASLGNVNNPRGLGYNAGTAAMNAAVSRGVQASDMIGGRMGSASYGRRQSDGTVTGTTRSGTGYTSRDGGNSISVGGRTYSKNRRGTYSLNVGKR
jgi:hypothetical protein